MQERALTFGLSMCLLGVYLTSTPPHLVSDLAGGLLVVLIPFYALPEKRPPPVRGARGNLRRALFYLIPSAMSFLASVTFWPWSSVLLWPALCYLVVCWAYVAGKPTVFQKADGKLDWAAAILLAPHTLLSRSSLPYLRRRVEPWSMAAPQVYFGRLLSEKESMPPDIVAVLDLTAEHSEPERMRQFAYLNLPMLDQTLPTPAQLDEAVAFIRRHLDRGNVYIHCAFGYSRSAGVAAAYMLRIRWVASATQAARDLKARRPQVSLSRRWLALLHQYAATVPTEAAVTPADRESSSHHSQPLPDAR